MTGQNDPLNSTSQDTLIGHLIQLRKRLIYSLYGIFIGCLLCWLGSDFLFAIIRMPIEPFLTTDSKGLIYTGVMDKFMAYIKISFLGGIIFTCPYWLYHVWIFIAPGLYLKEKTYTFIFVILGSLLFLTGVAFVYFIVYDLVFYFLMNFGDPQDVPLISIDKYLSFFITTTLVFGLAFELPLILTFLSLMGILSRKDLIEKRPYAIVLLAILSALLTPPDVISMALMMGPLLLLYEISIFAVGVISK